MYAGVDDIHKRVQTYLGKYQNILNSDLYWWDYKETWKAKSHNLMFFWLCIMNWLYEYINYQLDALIIIYS